MLVFGNSNREPFGFAASLALHAADLPVLRGIGIRSACPDVLAIARGASVQVNRHSTDLLAVGCAVPLENVWIGMAQLLDRKLLMIAFIACGQRVGFTHPMRI